MHRGYRSPSCTKCSAETPVASFDFHNRNHQAQPSLAKPELSSSSHRFVMRLCKIALLAAAAFHLLLVVFNNVVDYPSNYRFVQHVLGMDTLFSGEAQTWRALRPPAVAGTSSWPLHAAYVGIIVWEGIACSLIALGAVRLWSLRNAPAKDFNAAKTLGTVGLTASLLLWFFAFISIGAEWFLMWQSKSWNGLDAASRLFACQGIILLFLNQRDEDS